ncbi:MAG TPA: bifunctional riboflavin kinase/FAD synthetase [Candidatus Acidoferrum sp.]|jgi:riboflavin kinase/FMN adenylyltransferase|nr:bifunctional riboflavin kinase/FAD synthetase [Candidatus Acidoferrum sp.]
MRILRGLESVPPDVRPSVVALGIFDGVHLGHRAILGTAITRAREAGLEAVACTFEPHPMEVLQPDRAPRPITTLADRLVLIGEAGVDAAVVLAFTRELAAVEPEAFVKDVLLERLRAREIVVGYNHRFGRGARGDARLLEDLATRAGFRAHVVPPMTVDGAAVSSSEIRSSLQRGDVVAAARSLGRPYAIAGTVTSGAGRGRTLGFPTANIESDRPLLVSRGVYWGRVHVDQGQHSAVVNVGVRPTFGETTLAVEAHLLDFTGDLYGRHVRLDFLDRLRDEMRFPSVEDLKAQVFRDIAAARGRS